jgi:hypothetical protein
MWLLVLVLVGCSIIRPFPTVDLSAPGWTEWTGQALWQPEAGQPAIAGEIVLARHKNGNVLISFSKPPVPIFTVQTSGKRWKIDFIHTQRTHSGASGPPSRFIWFQIPALLQNSSAPQGWQVEAVDKATWHLRNPDSGESIRLVLD